MAQSVFDLTDNPELRTLLEERMRRQQFLGNRLAKWIAPGFITSNGGGEEVQSYGPEGPMKWSGAPIETQEAFIQKGRTDMLVPVRNRLIGDPVFGGVQLLGTAEKAAYAYRSVFINRTRKAYAPPTGMEEQKTRQYYTMLVADADQQLRTWFNDFMPSNIILALVAGYSRDLVNGVQGGGRAIDYVSHPNLYAAGLGQISYGGGRPGTAGYEVSVEAAVNGLVGNPGQTMTVAFLKNLVVEASRKKIRKIVTKDGFEFYPVWIKDAQWTQLQNDPDFQSLAKSLHISELSKHPLGNGMAIYIAECAIYVDNKLFCAYTNQSDANVTAGTVEYGPRPTAVQRGSGSKLGDTMTQLDTGNVAVGLLIGQSCATIGTGKKIRYTDEMLDHENVKEVGIEYIQSVVRNETYDTLGLIPGLSKGDFYENTSSLAFMTYSPFALTY